MPLVLFLTACHRQVMPPEVLPQDRMADFLTDAYLLEGEYAVSSQYRFDSISEGMLDAYDSILDLHGTTVEQVEFSLDYYSQHLDLYQAIQDTVVARLEARIHNSAATR